MMVRQVVKTVEVAAQSLLQHSQYQNLPQVHPRTPDCAVGLRQDVLVQQHKQPRTSGPRGAEGVSTVSDRAQPPACDTCPS